MLIQIKNVTKEWTAPDGKVTIWSLFDQDGNKWSTMSERIASSEGQTMELATRQNAKGQTYLIQPPREAQPGQPQYQSAQYTPTPTQPPSAGGNAVGRFEIAVDAFERAVDKFSKAVFPATKTPMITVPPVSGPYAAPSGDVVPTDIPNDLQGADAFQAALDAFGGGEEVKDDVK